MSRLRALAGVSATAVIALVGWSCEANRTALAPSAGGPLFHFQQFECTPLKMTGGGRIDFPPGTRDQNPPASHEYETFGAHVIASGQVDENGRCLADKGALEWVDHRPEMEVDGHPLNLHASEVTFAEVRPQAERFVGFGPGAALHFLCGTVVEMRIGKRRRQTRMGQREIRRERDRFRVKSHRRVDVFR